ncbi:thermopsin family protease, partial [Acidianus sp. DSM 29099]|nr:thermopsin family protease [Acidianus sp. RZ1]
DAELVLGGPGGGSEAYILYSQVYMQLQYWNGNNFQEIRNAYNFGSDTAETSTGINDGAYYYIASGIVEAGLTAGSSSLTTLWQSNQIETLKVYTPISQGYAYVFNYTDGYGYQDNNYLPRHYFVGSSLELTLSSEMSYIILVYNQYGELVSEGYSPMIAGNYTVYTEQFSISPSIYNTTLSQGGETSIQFTVNGEGPVYISVSSPLPYSLSQNSLYLQGQGSFTLTLSGTNVGIYTVNVTVDFLNGMYEATPIEVVVNSYSIPITFYIQVNGQSLPSSPTVTFEFPNGTIIAMPISQGTTLRVPQGTTYSVQQIIGEGNV